MLAVFRFIQYTMSKNVSKRSMDGQKPAFLGLKSVAGVDISFFKGDTNLAIATLVILDFPELKV
ncbi:hypothetical protein L0F63_000534, partial [Massospora cicadina]